MAKKTHPVTKYAKAVIKGKIMANRWVTLACKRHIEDLDRKDIYFDEQAADHIISFYEEFLVFYEGEWDTKPFLLEPWEKFIVGSLFGWKSKDGYRRFRTAYIEIGKGNGKSPLAGGIGLYGLTFDNEPGAEIYSAAVTREQAGILFRDAKAFVEGSEALNELLVVGQHNIAYIKENSFFRPVSSEKRGLDGKRPHFALIDEIHEHPNSIVVDKIRAGTKGRRQALIVEITNSGYDQNTICFQHHEYTEKILEKTLSNDSWFGYITGLDVCAKCEADGKTIPQDGCPDCDDWRNPKVWKKANPNLGVSIKSKYLEEQVAEAIGMPNKVNIVKRLNFNIWTEGITKWISADKWNSCTDSTLKITDFIGKPCYAGLDLASKIDVCSLELVFSFENLLLVFGKHYIPADTVRESRNRLQYEKWIESGRMIQTPGAMTDFKYIEDDLRKINENHPIIQLAFDPREAGYLINNIMEWTKEDTCVEINQGPALINEPMKELEARISSRLLWHDGDPVLAWMMSNVVLKDSRGGPVKYYYPTKTSSDNKIDGAVALIMAIGRAMLKEGPVVSIYDGMTPDEIKNRMAM